MSVEQMTDLVHTTIGMYRLDSLIGRGGTSDVYLGVHQTRGIQVAIKVVRANEDSNLERRFLSEAQLMSNLDHPDIVRLYDYFESKGYLAMAVEYVPGRSLDEILETSSLSLRQSIEIFRKVLRPIAYLHGREIVHRDIKPGNIRVTPEGQVKILDFGIAKTIDSRRYTRVGKVVGTPAYLSPELRAGDIAKPSSDVWSLGIMLKEMTQSGLSKTGFAQSQMGSVFQSPEERTVRKILAGCLQRKPQARYQSAHEIERDLEAVHISDSVPSWLTPKILAITGAIVICVVATLFTLSRSSPGPSSNQILPPPSASPFGQSTTPSQPVPATASPLNAPIGGAIAVTIYDYDKPADIYIDGQLVGKLQTGPTILQISEGRHRLELRQGSKTVYGPNDTTISGANNYFSCSIDSSANDDSEH